MGEKNSSKAEIWDEWNAIHYVPIKEHPFFTTGSSIMGEKLEVVRGVEYHDSFYYYEIEWIPNKMTFSIDGEIVRTIEGAEVNNLNEP